MDDELDLLPIENSYDVGCLECGSVFTIEDLYGGGCPICQSQNVVTFADALAMIIAHREFMESMGLEEHE